MVIKDKKKFYKYLFLYRSFFFSFTRFTTNLNDRELENVIAALNIKKRRERIYFIINNLCDQIDDYYKNKNICSFCNGKCGNYRKNNLDYKNGCCRKCRYQSSSGCTSKNFACKMFNCTYVKERYKTIKYNDLVLLKVLTPLQRLVLKDDYFSSIDEVTNDLFFGPIYAIVRMMMLGIKIFFSNNK